MSGRVYSPRAYIGLYDGAYERATIEDATDAVNTTGKTLGKRIFDLESGRIVYATGTGATDPWSSLDETSVEITPS